MAHTDFVYHIQAGTLSAKKWTGDASLIASTWTHVRRKLASDGHVTTPGVYMIVRVYSTMQSSFHGCFRIMEDGSFVDGLPELGGGEAVASNRVTHWPPRGYKSNGDNT